MSGQLKEWRDSRQIAKLISYCSVNSEALSKEKQELKSIQSSAIFSLKLKESVLDNQKSFEILEIWKSPIREFRVFLDKKMLNLADLEANWLASLA